MFEFPQEGYRTRIDIVVVAGTILRRQRRRIPGILDMGHLAPQDIRVADVGLELNIVYIPLFLISILILILFLTLMSMLRLIPRIWITCQETLVADIGLEVNIIHFVLALDVDALFLEADVDVDSKDMGHLPP